jgi:aminoglycoside phosphotransferase (APT) family kinase protein
MDLAAAGRAAETALGAGVAELIEPLHAGYSTDAKYVAWEGGTPAYLVRLSEGELFERRKHDFALVERLWRAGAAVPRPYAVGMLPGGEACYVVVEWLAGTSAEEALPALSTDVQRELGRRAGVELRRVHELGPADPDIAVALPERRLAKYRRQAARVDELGIVVAGIGAADAYVARHQALVATGEIGFQHDDYHPANLIIDGERFAGVIDFNRCDTGDPIEDFHKLPWFTVPVSTPFAAGQVEGYWAAGGRQDDFWERYNLYVAMNLGAGVAWIADYYPERVPEWLERIATILATHDFEDGTAPAWFQET